jgi:hypothetical protein
LALEERLDRMAEELVTRRRRVVDGAGANRVVVDTSSDTRSITLMSEAGIERVALRATDSAGQVAVYSTEDDVLITMAAHEEMSVPVAELAVVDKDRMAPFSMEILTGGVRVVEDDEGVEAEWGSRLRTIESVITAIGGAAQTIRRPEEWSQAQMDWCREMTADMNCMKMLLFSIGAIAEAAPDRPTPVPPDLGEAPPGTGDSVSSRHDRLPGRSEPADHPQGGGPTRRLGEDSDAPGPQRRAAGGDEDRPGVARL